MEDLVNLNLASELLSTHKENIINKNSLELINLNNKKKKIESLILNDINFNKLDKNHNQIIIYYNPNINEGLISIIASRIKRLF